MPKGRKQSKHYFTIKPGRFSSAIFPFILLEHFQRAFRLNIRLSVTFRVEFVLKKVPLQQLFSDCL